MRWLPRSLFGRLVLLMTVGLVIAQLAGTAIHLRERQRSLGHTVSHELAQRIAAIHRAIDSQARPERQRLAKLLSTPRFALSIERFAPVAKDVPTMLADFADRLRDQLGAEVELRTIALPRFGAFVFDVYLKLSEDEWLRIYGGAPDDIIAQPWHVLINLGVMLLAIVVLVILVARSTVRPLTQLAVAAHGLADDLKHPPLPEEGPSEVQEAAKAFNAMQTRIRSGIEERERFLAAVSHDLKTPVTRLRLRAEMLTDQNLREDIRRDADDMQRLIDDALDFLRGKSVAEPVQPIDLVALVESVVDDFAHTGHVSLEAPDMLRLNGRPRALQRALRNLVDNALKYGESAHVVLEERPDSVVISVEDDGQGIPENELEAAFEPFYRIEGSRSRETGGTGLGLAIVRQVARSHGGDAVLRNRPNQGVRAELRLPR
jgi:signal transduction histidine kinase